MKKYLFTTVTFLFVSLTSMAQVLWDNFDDQRNVEYGFFSGIFFDQESENPDDTGINNSPLCARYIRNAGEEFDVLIIEPQSGFILDDLSDYTASLKKMSMLINTTAVSIVQITLENSNLALPANYPTGRHSVYTASTSGDGVWEELEFNFVERPDPAVSDFAVNRMVVLFAPGTFTADEYFFDDLFGPELVEVEEGMPANPAPTPTIAEENVISMFSGAYPDVIVDTWRTGWSQAGLEEIEIQGNPTKKYTNLDFVGIETVTNQLDVSEMTHFSIDIWSEDITAFRIKLVDFGPDGVFVGGDDSEDEIEFTDIATETWVTLRVPLSDFAGLTGRENIAQLILSANPAGNVTLFVDNVFYYADDCIAVTPDETILEDFECQRNLDLFANGTLEVIANPVTDGLNDAASSGRFTKVVSGDGAFGGSLMYPFTSAEYKTIHMQLLDQDVAKPFLVILQDESGADIFTRSFNTIPSGEWVNYAFDLSSIDDASSISTIVLLLNPGSPTADFILIDNISISNEPVEEEDPCADIVANPSILEDFECHRNVDYEFVNGTLQVVDNPLVGDPVNENAKVGRFTKFVPPTNDGAFGGNLANPFQTADFMTAHISLYDPNAPQSFLVIFRNEAGDNVFEETITTEANNQWTEYMVNISAIPSATIIDKVLLLLNPATSTEDFIFLDNFYLSNFLSVAEAQKDSLVKVYPNPVNDVLTIRADRAMDRIIVSDITGKQVYDLRTSGLNESLAFDAVAKGTYNVRIIFEDQTSQMVKIIK